jgi:Flp pilus assembly protein TadD
MFDRYRNIIIGVAVLIAAVVGAQIYLSKDEKVGLYQHIRKAEKYMEEGKYEKGLFYLHKAYEEAPRSEKIRQDLMAGYIEYARFLYEIGDTASALDYMSMAYEMDPESLPVMNDLAYYYATKAVENARQGDRALAVMDLEDAKALARKSGKIRTNIANYLFNKALEARGRNDRNTLFLCLNASHDLKPRFESLDFLGQFFYEKNDLERAIFYWEKALAVRSGDVKMIVKLRKARNEMDLESKMKKTQTPNFEVSLYSDHDIDIGKLESFLGETYDLVGKDLEYYPPPGTRIIFYSEDDFREVFQKEGIIRAFYDGSLRIAVTGDIQDIFLPGIIAHEYTHAVVSIITDNRCPVWLHEGLAVYQQSRYMPIQIPYVMIAVSEGRRLTIDEIEEGFKDINDQNIVGLSYEGAYMAVKFMLEKWGWSGVRGLLDKIKEEGHFSNALDEQLYISVKTFEDMWNEYLAAQILSERS